MWCCHEPRPGLSHANLRGRAAQWMGERSAAPGHGRHPGRGLEPTRPARGSRPADGSDQGSRATPRGSPAGRALGRRRPAAAYVRLRRRQSAAVPELRRDRRAQGQNRAQQADADLSAVLAPLGVRKMSEIDSKPHDEDLRNDDQEYNPAVEPKSAKAWLNLLQESEDAFESWNAHCDNIDRLYASLERLGSPKGYRSNIVRSKEFQLFWANCEVIKPAIYAKAPVPVVVPKFKDRRPVYQEASEVMERSCVVAFDLTRIND